jgi:multicomponent Na+:H+ antiporter subunit G
MIETFFLWSGWFLIFLGVFLVITGALGILRFPDIFSRLHPAGIIDSCATICILLGLVLHHGFTLFSGKLILLTLLILITGPTATHVLAKVAMLQGTPLPKKQGGKNSK